MCRILLCTPILLICADECTLRRNRHCGVSSVLPCWLLSLHRAYYLHNVEYRCSALLRFNQDVAFDPSTGSGCGLRQTQNVLSIILFIPFCEFTQAFSQRYLRSESKISFEGGTVCVSDGDVTRLHCNQLFMFVKIKV